MKSKVLLYCLFLVFFLLSPNRSESQNKQDYVWLWSNNSTAQPGKESYGFDFNYQDGGNIQGLQGLIPIEFSGNNASICDQDGNLLFYSNGCHVVGANHEILPNGAGINEGIWVDTILDTCTRYPSSQDIMLLEDPGAEFGYYLIHNQIQIENNSFFRELKYSYINKSLNDGFGDVTEKNVTISDTIYSRFHYLTAIKHSNKSDYWISLVEEYSTKIRLFKLSITGFEFVNTFEMPTTYIENVSGAGTARFSPDGFKYALYNAHENLILLDFDRSNGTFYNLRQLEINSLDSTIIRLGSVEWSSNSRFLYISDEDKLWQVDTWEENLEDGLILIDTWNGINDPFSTIFFVSALAPDCKIYICSASSTNSYHVINNPNAKGKACDFVQQGVRLPFVSAIATMPNFPRFRVDEEEKCDPTITSVFGDQVFWRRDLKTYPNPAIEFITIEVPEQQRGSLFIVDMMGNIVQTIKELSQSEIRLDISDLSFGIYSIEFVPDNNTDKVIYTSRLNKI